MHVSMPESVISGAEKVVSIEEHMRRMISVNVIFVINVLYNTACSLCKVILNFPEYMLFVFLHVLDFLLDFFELFHLVYMT